MRFKVDQIVWVLDPSYSEPKKAVVSLIEHHSYCCYLVGEFHPINGWNMQGWYNEGEIFETYDEAMLLKCLAKV